jgi:shikimate kinase
LDDEIEKRTGKSPRALFKEGRETFMAAEAKTLDALLREHSEGIRLVIALGGGIIDNEAALRIVNPKRTKRPSQSEGKAESASGTNVKIAYMEISAREAWKRIENAARNGGGMPPFLDTPDPRGTHRALHERRAAAYKNLADIIIDCENKNPREIALEIFPPDVPLPSLPSVGEGRLQQDYFPTATESIAA